MPALSSVAHKVRFALPWQMITAKRAISIQGGAVWPIGIYSDYELPNGIPMAVVDDATGEYVPAPRSYLTARLASGAATLTLNDVDGFAPGMFICAYTDPDAATSILQDTIVSVDYENNQIVIAGAADTVATNGWIERDDICHLVAPANRVILLENVKTQDDNDADVVCESVGVRGGQVEVVALRRIGANCYDSILASELPQIDFIPQDPSQT